MRSLLLCALTQFVLLPGCGGHHLGAKDGAIDGPAVSDGAGADGTRPKDAPVDPTASPDAGSDAAPAEAADAPAVDAPVVVNDAAPDTIADLVRAAADAGPDLLSRSPSCSRTYGFDWNAPITTQTRWFIVRGAPSVDMAAHELLLPYDSKVTTVIVSESDFVLEFDLTIDGDLTFLVQGVYSDDQFVPSITRVGSEMVLSTTKYGAAASAPGGGFTGQRFPAQRVHVTIFDDSYAHRIGMKVDTATQSFWSKLVEVPINPNSLTLVGANLPGERGTTARIHLGPMSGCDRHFDSSCSVVPPGGSGYGFCSGDGGAAADTPPL